MSNSFPKVIDFDEMTVLRAKKQLGAKSAFDFKINKEKSQIVFSQAGKNKVSPNAADEDGNKDLDGYSFIILADDRAIPERPIIMVLVPQEEGVVGKRGMKTGRAKHAELCRFLYEVYKFESETFNLVKLEKGFEDHPSFAIFADEANPSSYRGNFDENEVEGPTDPDDPTSTNDESDEFDDQTLNERPALNITSANAPQSATPVPDDEDF